MAKQPSSRMCFVCGVANPVGLRLSFYQEEHGVVRAHWTPPEKYQSYPGVLHGGIAAAALDEVAGRTAMGTDPARFLVTVTMDLKYRRPVPVGQPLTLVGRLTRDRGRLVRAHAELCLADGSVGAEAEVLLAEAPQDFLGFGDLDRLGWKVYPDETGDA